MSDKPPQYSENSQQINNNSVYYEKNNIAEPSAPPAAGGETPPVQNPFKQNYSIPNPESYPQNNPTYGLGNENKNDLFDRMIGINGPNIGGINTYVPGSGNITIVNKGLPGMEGLSQNQQTGPAKGSGTDDLAEQKAKNLETERRSYYLKQFERVFIPLALLTLIIFGIIELHHYSKSHPSKSPYKPGGFCYVAPTCQRCHNNKNSKH